MQVDFTLAVAPNGLPTGTGSEYALLQDAQAKGVKVSVVNIMTMDFYDGSNNDLGDAESAVAALEGRLADPALYAKNAAEAGRLKNELVEAQALVATLKARWEELEARRESKA